MNKKLNYLSIIPLYGTIILLIYLYILSIKGDISKKKFAKSFFVCGIISALCWFLVLLIVTLFSKENIEYVYNSNLIIIVFIIAGYLINLFTFYYLNKKGESLFDNSYEVSFFDRLSTKKVLIIGLILAAIIIIICFPIILIYR